MTERLCGNMSSCSPYMIWRNYSIGIMSLSIVPLLCSMASSNVYPFLTLAMSLALFAFVRGNRRSKSENCAFLPYIAARVLLLFTFVSVAAVLLFSYVDRKIMHLLPNLSMLLLSVAVLVVWGIMRYRSVNNTFCVDCILRNGVPYEREALGHIYFREIRYLLRRVGVGAFAIALVEWVYYLFFFDSRLELTRLDNAVFIYFPILAAVVDCAILGFRYFVIDIFYRRGEGVRNYDGLAPVNGTKVVRVVVFSLDKVYYQKRKGGSIYDTPFEFVTDYSETPSSGEAVTYMTGRLGALPVNAVRFCYGSSDPVNRRGIEHFFCFVDDDADVDKYEESTATAGRWFDKPALEREFYAGSFSKMASSEIHRIYTIMVTSKLYDVKGRRKIGDKGYVPSFTMEELRTVDVDFNDSHWMMLSKFNKDIPFRWLRVVWYKYVEGLG